MQNFLGHDGFVWWVGVVEDIRDPETLGRCKVRVFGYHDDSSLIPTVDLPWSTAIHSPNTPNLYSPLEVEDWVFGFFLDSLNAQEPAIVGVIPSKFANTQVTRSFNRVHTNGNSGNTTCLELGNSYIEVVEKSLTEPNGHIQLSHNKANTTLSFTTNNDFEVYTVSNANTISNNLFITSNTLTATIDKECSITSNTIIIDTEANTTFNSGNTSFQSNESFSIESNYISIDSATALRFADANNDVTLQTLVTWIQRAWSEANSAHAAANTAGAVANAATVRLNSPTFGSSNGFTAIVGI
jgi:hypothetical protein